MLSPGRWLHARAMPSSKASDLHPILSSEATSLAKLLPVAIHGQEGLSRPYRFMVELHDPHAAAPAWSGLAGSWLNKQVSLDLGPLDHSKAPNVIDGLVAAVELLGVAKDGDDGNSYRIEVVPRLWLLSLTRQTRVFQSLTPLEVVQRVLQESNITFTNKANSAKSTHANAQLSITQYDETDLDFITRLLEDQGICYWFEHSGKSQGSTLILANETGSHPGPDQALSMEPGHAALRDMRSVGLRVALTPTTTTVAGYDLNDPLVSRNGSKPIPAAKAPVRHGTWTTSGNSWLGGGKQAEVADQMAAVVADRHINEAHTFSGASTDIRFRAGRRVSMPHGDCLLTAVEHHWLHPLAGGGADTYHNSFSWLSWSALPWRPPFTAPRPRLDALVQGVVTATAGSQGDSDEGAVDGSYRVKLLHASENTERIARLAQPYGGDQRGLHCPLPIDTEVLIAHINGNPDQPVIASAVPNLNAPGPVTEGNQTQCILKTGSGHSLVFEDKQKEEKISLTSKTGQKLLIDDKDGAPKIQLANADATQGLLIDSTSGSELVHLTAVKDLKATITGTTTIDSTGELLITSQKKITLQVGQATLTLDDQGNITLNGQKIELSAKQDLKGSGLNVELSAQAGVKISGTAQAEVTSSGKLTIQGTMVMIN